MKMMLYHLTGSLQGRRQYFDTDSISFGIGEHCGIVFDAVKDAAVCPVHAELAVEDQTPILRDRSGRQALLVNGKRTDEASLQDGDLIQFGEGGPLVRFRLLSDGNPEAKPWQHIVADSRDIVVRMPHARYTSLFYLARHVLADVTRYGSLTAKLVAAGLLLIPLAIAAALGLAAYYQYQAAGASERKMAELMSRIETGRLTRAEMEQRIELERHSVAELRQAHEALVGKLNAALKEQEASRQSRQEIQAIRRQLIALESSQRFAEEIVRRFENGVGLLQGGYGFKEKDTGRPLRYQGLDPSGNPLRDKDGNALVTVEGSTPPVVIYYAGTGFLVDQAGTIVTNRHMVRMWETYEPAQEAIAAGFVPDLLLLRVFFPGNPNPYKLDVLRVSEQADLALLRTDRVPVGATPLPLLTAGDQPRAGEPVVVLSYPGSFDSILGRLAGPVSEEILHEADADPVKLADALARHRLVSPLATQGHVADVSPEIITFEATSSGGSSGSPVFGRTGQVIAINRAGLRKAGGLNVGLPSRLAGDLLNAEHGTPAQRQTADAPMRP